MYVNTYIGEIGENNYVIVSASSQKHDSLVTYGTFLHNTKITTSEINEKKNT